MANIDLGKWYTLDDIFKLIESNIPVFTEEDFHISSDNDLLQWQRNLIGILLRKVDRQEILYDSKFGYKIVKPYVWRMIREAVDNGNSSYSEIRKFIEKNWTAVNINTITAQTVVLTVNHTSRVHYPENSRPRFTNTGSVYDYLYYTGRGSVVKYDKGIHGLYEIFNDAENTLSIRKCDVNLFTPDDITWFKSVSNSEIGQAYMDGGNKPFILNFPNVHATNSESPSENEIILIYQRLFGRPVFTHLVTPIGANVIDENIRSEYRYGRLVKIIAKTGLNTAIPVQSTLLGKMRLSGVTQGNVCRLDNIKNVNEIENIKLDLWEKFTPYFLPEENSSLTTVSTFLNEIEDSSGLSVIEGSLKLVKHYIRERNRKIVNEKKNKAIEKDLLYCEVCNFSFKNIFDKNFIECHHIYPIASNGSKETTLDDLALVCANCHRMLHLKFEDKFLSIADLKKMIEKI